MALWLEFKAPSLLHALNSVMPFTHDTTLICSASGLSLYAVGAALAGSAVIRCTGFDPVGATSGASRPMTTAPPSQSMSTVGPSDSRLITLPNQAYIDYRCEIAYVEVDEYPALDEEAIAEFDYHAVVTMSLVDFFGSDTHLTPSDGFSVKTAISSFKQPVALTYDLQLLYYVVFPSVYHSEQVTIRLLPKSHYHSQDLRMFHLVMEVDIIDDVKVNLFVAVLDDETSSEVKDEAAKKDKSKEKTWLDRAREKARLDDEDHEAKKKKKKKETTGLNITNGHLAGLDGETSKVKANLDDKTAKEKTRLDDEDHEAKKKKKKKKTTGLDITDGHLTGLDGETSKVKTNLDEKAAKKEKSKEKMALHKSYNKSAPKVDAAAPVSVTPSKPLTKAEELLEKEVNVKSTRKVLLWRSLSRRRLKQR
ncbi:OLC1v1017743C1 [Oldenlandia corymbosa var. corymbosa]|uniref:OLC1v1017743C1 n=1 Tax=Oldenlandia corymbosa var. corymbosa TaxID=529605 RepID=A0AAV1EA92_OLDCO|nr:OLC1v1017743C1 [Oldenlandia corymbosa var. corymbosa]